MHVLKQPKRSNEQGIVSIMVTIILMMVISLIVISFARTSRREQRDSLDRQLSTNAFYAAESGVNAARKAISLDPTRLLSTQYISECTGPGSFSEAVGASLPVPSSNIGSNSSNASYTCLFVDPTVSSIERSPDSRPFNVTLKKAGGGALGGATISWDAGSGSTFNGCPAMNTNPPTQTNCDAGVLRVEITDLASRFVYFVYPDGSPAAAVDSFAYGDTNKSHRTKCGVAGAPQQCQFTLTGLGVGPYYAHISSAYKPFELTIRPTGPNTEFEGAQVLIDSTGKAADVQRRIQVRYNPSDIGGPSYALQAGAAICKQFSLDDSKVTDESDGHVCWPSPTTRSDSTLLP